jgi:putative transposase
MKQNMSIFAHCIDNEPIERFWGILKRETYYRHRYQSCEELKTAIEAYMHYYNTERIQRRLGRMTPQEFHERYGMTA